MLATQVSKSLFRPVVARAFRPVAVRAFAASPWGGDAWRHEKNAFKQWCKDSVAPGQTQAKRELYGFLGIAFGDVDADKDGFINAKEFDLLLEKVAAVPRRYGLAPSWEKEYSGDALKRKAARQAMFDQLDTRNGPARGVIGMKQFMRWATAHITEKVATIDTKTKVDFYNIADYDEATFMNYLEHALANPTSGAYASLYEFLLTCFIESDVECKGTISRKEFSDLLCRAAKVPRQFGLAPPDASEGERDKIFASMDTNNEGYVTFRKFLAWTVEHTKHKVELQRAGKGYKK
jgi:uncharacterized membrane protein